MDGGEEGVANLFHRLYPSSIPMRKYSDIARVVGLGLQYGSLMIESATLTQYTALALSAKKGAYKSRRHSAHYYLRFEGGWGGFY